MNDAAGTASSEGRRLRAEREAERIFEMSPALLGVAGFDGYLKRFNPAFAVFGYSREELLSRPWIEFAHPHDRERMAQAAAALERGADVVELDNRVVCRDGSLRWVEWKTRVVPEEALFYAAGRDVTETRRAAEEQAALRRVATLVAQETAPDAVFAAVAREVGEVLGVDATHLGRYDGDHAVVSVAQWGSAPGIHVGERFPLEGDSVSARVLKSGRPARMDDYEEARGAIATTIRGMGIRSAVGAPISVGGRTWGVMTATSKRQTPFPAETESRLQGFTELVATAISNATAITRRRRLEMDVAERSAELERSEAYLAEGQRLTRAGSVAFSVPNWEVTHSSAEHSRLYGFDPERGLPSMRDFSDRIHPEDRSIPGETLQRGVRERTAVEAEFRVIVPDAGQRRLLATAQPVFDASGQITECVATVIDVTERRQTESELERLAAEQAALRRVAVLVAREGSQAEVFEAIADECAQLFGTQEIRLVRFDEGTSPSEVVVASLGNIAEYLPVGSRQPLVGENMTSRVFRAGRPARIDDYAATASGPIGDALKAAGIRSMIGAPVMVEGRLWGAMGVGSRGSVLPPSSESRLGEFTELMATAIANTESHARADRLADEQAALGTVATLVAEGVEPAELFSAVTKEVSSLFADVSPLLVPSVIRFDPGPEFVLVGAAVRMYGVPMGSRWGLKDLYVSTRVFRTERSARIDESDLASLGGPDAELLRRQGFLYQVGSPIVVEGRLWGAMTMNSKGALPPDTGERLEKFTELVATAIANAESREALSELAQEQAALRRVATLAAEGAPPGAVLDAVVGEMEALLEADQVALNRFEPGDEIVVLAHRGLDVDRTPVGSRVSIEGESATAKVRSTGRPARMEDYELAEGALADLARTTDLRSSVSAPITVEGGLWGLITASWKGDRSPPPDTEERMAKFAGLLDTAIASTEARTEVERLADEQAALRRVATLVAHESPAAEVFAAVAEEVGRLLGIEDTTIFRYEDDWTATVVADRGERDIPMPVGSRVSLEGLSATALVRRTGRSARVDDFSSATGPLADYTRDAGVGSTVGSPIVADGRLWGAMIAATRTDEAMPGDTESRMAQFTGLVATAISNMQARLDLAASRARIVEAADDERRRVVRDLHDGAQQRLVHTILTLKLARRAFQGGDGNAKSLVLEALQHAERGNAELRELAHGILPAALTHGGLRAALDTYVARLDLPVRVDVPDERFPADIEASAYFVVAEALTNVVKHSQAGSAEVAASVDDGTLHLEIRDDGIGGADPNGNGLVGMDDRVTALGGRLNIESPPGSGTRVAATVPLRAE